MEFHLEQEEKLIPSSSKSHNSYHLVLAILKGSIPTLLSNFFINFLDTLCFIYLGQHEDAANQLAAFGFALTWSIVTSVAISFAICISFSIIGSKLYGAKQYRDFGLLLQKSQVIMLIAFLCSCIIFFLTPYILEFLGFDQQLAADSTLILKYSIPYYLIYGFYYSLCLFLVAQGIYHVNAFTSILGAMIQLIVGYFFILYLDWGFLGIGVSKTISSSIMLFATLYYIRSRHICPQAWIPWTKECLYGIWDYTKTILRLGFPSYLQWLMFEFITILIGRLNDPVILAGQAQVFGIGYLIFGIHFAFTITGSSKMGNAIGEDKPALVLKVAKVVTIINFVVTICLVGIIFLFQDEIGRIYTEDQSVFEVFKIILMYYGLAIPFEMANNMMGYFLRNLGYEMFFMRVCLLGYYGVIIPFAFVLGFPLGYSYRGIFISLLIGYMGISLVLLRKLCSIDWKLAVNKSAFLMKEAERVEEIEIEFDRLYL